MIERRSVPHAPPTVTFSIRKIVTVA